MRVLQHVNRSLQRPSSLSTIKTKTTTAEPTSTTIQNLTGIQQKMRRNTIATSTKIEKYNHYPFMMNMKANKSTQYQYRELSSISIPFSSSSRSNSISDDVGGKKNDNSAISLISSIMNNNNVNVNNVNDEEGIKTTIRKMEVTNHNNEHEHENKNDIETKLDHYTNRQVQLLAFIEELHNQNDSNDDNNNNYNNKNDTKNDKSTVAMMKEKGYLNELWKIANEMDVLLNRHYHHSLSSSPSPSSKINNDIKEAYNMEHFNTVIDAWKIVMDAYTNSMRSHTIAYNKNNNKNNSNNIPLGIPQRATRLLETMENHCLQNNNNNINNNNPNAALSIDTYNNVLEMWSLSNEHNLDVRAESIFRRIYVEEELDVDDVGSSRSNIRRTSLPNVDTMKIMIRAWCKVYDNMDVIANTVYNGNESLSSTTSLSSSLMIENKKRNGSAIFKACGYLMQLQDLLEKGKNEFEPSLEDYLIVFQAWGEVT